MAVALDAVPGQKDRSERARGGMRHREMNRSFVARVFLYGMATGLMIALVLCFIDSMLSHRLGEIVWGR